MCDGDDNDCDTVADNGLSFDDYYIDGDGDGFGQEGDSPDNLCSNPGAGFATNDSDCNDSDPAIKPTASEDVGDAFDVDENCDDIVECYVDADNDGYMTDKSATVGTGLIGCSANGAAYDSEPTGDCDDGDGNNFPTNTEVCDGEDNDCDTVPDNGLTFIDYYADNDGDGFGDRDDTPDNLCADPGVAFSTDSTDCDDGNPAINTDATEIIGDAGDVDEDCDDAIDYM